MLDNKAWLACFTLRHHKSVLLDQGQDSVLASQLLLNHINSSIPLWMLFVCWCTVMLEEQLTISKLFPHSPEHEIKIVMLK